MKNNPREVGLQILEDINLKKAYSNIELNKHINKDFDPRDENLIRELVYGVLENQIYIDYIIKNVSKIPLKKIHSSILQILRMGIYQLIFMDRIPDRAAVNESVNLAKKHGHRGSVGYVNGILREISRNKARHSKIQIDDKFKEISIRYSHPEFLVREWVEEYGWEFTEALCRDNNIKPKLNIRVNRLKIEKKELKKILEAKSFQIEEGKYAEDCLIVNNPIRITETEEYLKGLFTIQDESSMLVGQLMKAKENTRLIDMCSAPGGKATHIGQYMKNKGYILSRDIYGHKLKLIEENSKRLGLDIIETQLYNAEIRDDSLVGKFDYCLLDAPCSGFGIFRRKPEIKLNASQEDVLILARLQKKLIDIAKDYLKPGGTLIYSTCTISKKENMDIIEDFLEKNKNFSLYDLSKDISIEDSISRPNKGALQLFPNIQGTDGFFIAKLIKEG